VIGGGDAPAVVMNAVYAEPSQVQEALYIAGKVPGAGRTSLYAEAAEMTPAELQAGGADQEC
jgi:hypothetical protein